MKTVFFLFSLVLLSHGALAEPIDAEAEYQKGLNSWSAGDIVGSMMPLKTAADAGHAKAQALFGALMDDADNDAEAAVYYEKAAQQDNADGAFGLASLLFSGDAGTKDIAKALSLYEKAAALGHTQSVIVLFVGYGNDDFLLGEASKDSDQAWKWTKKAAELEEIGAMIKLEEALRVGNKHIPKDVPAAESLRKKIHKMQGLDKIQNKRRSRL